MPKSRFQPHQYHLLLNGQVRIWYTLNYSFNSKKKIKNIWFLIGFIQRVWRRYVNRPCWRSSISWLAISVWMDTSTHTVRKMPWNIATPIKTGTGTWPWSALNPIRSSCPVSIDTRIILKPALRLLLQPSSTSFIWFYYIVLVVLFFPFFSPLFKFWILFFSFTTIEIWIKNWNLETICIIWEHIEWCQKLYGSLIRSLVNWKIKKLKWNFFSFWLDDFIKKCSL